MKIVTPLLLCAAAGAAGCASGEPEDGWAEDGAPPELVDDAPAPLMPRNNLTPAALSAGALWENRALLDVLSTSPLNDVSLARVLAAGPLSPTATQLLRYIVSCALDADPDRRVAGSSGELGLCGAASPEPYGDWYEEAPSTACQEVVTACVLARVNARGKRVRLSVRSDEDAAILPLLPVVPVEWEYRDPVAPRIKSLTTHCADGVAVGHPARDCGWSRRFVGTCQPGAPVVLKPRASAGGGGSHFMVRACKGIYGCDHATAPSPPWYAGLLADGVLSTDGRPGTTGELSFTCPHPGVPGPSSFAVIVAPPDPAGTLPAGADVTASGAAAQYPAPEVAVFRFREGAFYGNLFSNVHSAPPVPGAILSNRQYACYSNDWTRPMVHFTDRLCAGDAACFGNTPGPCRDSGVVPAPTPLCESGTLPGQNYRDCAGVAGGTRWEHVVTVFLNHPCDLASDPNHCDAAYAPFVPPPAGH
ncbi:hypothetical protein [Sorangium cellulosum]|nr:hypothetical protein [Sorangium cellulosum]